jgi:hypothetical protein
MKCFQVIVFCCKLLVYCVHKLRSEWHPLCLLVISGVFASDCGKQIGFHTDVPFGGRFGFIYFTQIETL